VSISGFVPSQGFIATRHSARGEAGDVELDLYGSILASNHDVFLWRGENGARTDYDVSRQEYMAGFYGPVLAMMRLQPPPPNHT
jgi:hypothetical protein